MAAGPKGRRICKNSEVFLLPLIQPELRAEAEGQEYRLQGQPKNPNSFFQGEGLGGPQVSGKQLGS